MVTSIPKAISCLAAVSPAMPAPIMITLPCFLATSKIVHLSYNTWHFNKIILGIPCLPPPFNTPYIEIVLANKFHYLSCQERSYIVTVWEFVFLIFCMFIWIMTYVWLVSIHLKVVKFAVYFKLPGRGFSLLNTPKLM